MVPSRAFPLSKDLGAEGDQAMKPAQEVRKASLRVGHDQVLMGAHEGDGVHEDAELLGTDAECVEIELADGGVRTEQVMAAKGAPGDHHGVAREHEAGLGHAHGWSRNQATPLSRDLHALRRRTWRISSTPTTDANVGEVPHDGCQRG